MMFAMNGIQIPRKELPDPKSVFDFLWHSFCEAEVNAMPAVLFFVFPEKIEVFDFADFTQSEGHKQLLSRLIRERIHQELDIEGVALGCEAYMKKGLNKLAPEQDAIVLTLSWRGVEKTFMRAAEKVKDGNAYKIANVEDSHTTSGLFTNFFDGTQAQIADTLLN